MDPTPAPEDPGGAARAEFCVSPPPATGAGARRAAPSNPPDPLISPTPAPPLLSLSCCVDLPSGTALVRYGLAEVLRGLGLDPVWTRRGDAQLVVAVGERDGEDWAVTRAALEELGAPRVPPVADLGWLDVAGVAWPVPVGPPGPATLGDAVAGAAWWLAGLQERATTARDVHGRVPYADSLQSTLGDAPGGPLRPAVDAVRERLGADLRRRGIGTPGRTWGGAPWAVALTHDLDAVRTRRLRAGLAGLARGRPAEAARRAFGPDRRRASVDDLHALGQRHGAAATWFVKPGAWSPEDVDGGLDPALVQTLRQWSAGGAEIGWHPGYGAHDHPARLAAEAGRFVHAFGAPPQLARTHFLRWTGPATPRLLAAHGVAVDSTLGWSAQPGFRRGTAHPFRLYDADAGHASSLWEMPLAVMDTTLAEHLALDAEAVAETLRATFDAARQRAGVAVVLWHNQVGGDTAGWTAMLDVLDRELGRARDDGAALGPLGALLNAWRDTPPQ